ncbi:MAG TPA: acetyl-CoA carboxylase biotin carboxylase subunit [Terriglobia bacterium]|nr:acetyl-CoA carboxylase biotin carboxylase subunit [Terriglobia bacterium]
MTAFKKLLVANRGEIAVRVMRACRELGISTVAVYSDADRKALHVRYADEAFHIGPAPAVESYLRIDRVLDAAKRSGAEAVHPGYGFLSENAEFARACAAEGLTFIGPPVPAMELMGSKTAARRALIDAGLPVVPGTGRNLESLEEVKRIAAQFGYPVMLKAASGGGGKGLRLVRDETEMESAFRTARSEAQNAFNDSSVYIEKYIERPRHIEFQIFGDHHGNLIHLCERECSLQRRHQKVLEESPSPAIDDSLRERMGKVAVEIGRLAGYTNAGTVEFLVDTERNFYFLEMNTRLQVEHPVTEEVLGIDLVKEQIRIAAGEPLGYGQNEIRQRGHAIECRVYAEDPENNFFPSPGLLCGLRVPAGPGVRDDSGVFEGWTVPLEYDPLLSKLVVWDRNRQAALARMRRALQEYLVAGIKTNITFFLRVLEHPDFAAGNFDTGFLDRMLADKIPEAEKPDQDQEQERIAALAAALASRQGPMESASNVPAPAKSAWKSAGLQSLLNQRP